MAGTLVRAGHGVSAVSPYLDQWVSFAMAILWLEYTDVISRVISVVDCTYVLLLTTVFDTLRVPYIYGVHTCTVVKTDHQSRFNSVASTIT